MIFKKLHKNKFINLGLLLLGFLIVAYFFKNYYFDKRKEGLANKCPKGCVTDDSLDGNCQDGRCPMICPNPDIGGSGCQYDSDCNHCPTSKPSKKKPKPHGSHNIGGDPSTWTPSSIIDGDTYQNSQSNNSMSDSSNTKGYNWSQIGKKVGTLIADSFDSNNNNRNKQHHGHHSDKNINNRNNNDNSFMSDIQNDWNNLVGGNQDDNKNRHHHHNNQNNDNGNDYKNSNGNDIQNHWNSLVGNR
jgi:hypothetical protein